MKKSLLLGLLIWPFVVLGQQWPSRFSNFLTQPEASKLANQAATISYRSITPNLLHVQVQWKNAQSLKQDQLKVDLKPAFIPDFHWSPHLTPDSGNIIAQHAFRAPAIIFSNHQRQLVMIPDLELMQKGTAVPWFMDMDARQNKMTVGMSLSEVTNHVLFQSRQGAEFPPGVVTIAFYLYASTSAKDLANPWRWPLDFMWKRWGKSLFAAGEPLLRNDLQPFVDLTYQWAFHNWRDAVWQQFSLDGQQVGAPVFIVNVTQSPNYTEPVNEREFRSIWNQAWFNSLRSASGLYRYARRQHIDSLKQKALMTKELALAFPQREGFFPSVIATEMELVEEEGKWFHRSKGWETRFFGNSNRNPYTGDARLSPYHIADMSFTAAWMLTWYEDLEKDARLLQYAERYADALMKIQSPDGFFPAWLSLVDLSPLPHLRESPETAVSASFLFRLYGITKDEKYLQAAQRAVNAVNRQIVPVGQWEDFETYWSCSRYGSNDLVGRKVARNNMFKQNTFSIFWTAEALYHAWKATGNKKYLESGQCVLDELLMAQAVWQPPFMAIRTLGGFGVMNADGEWNDARQSLFAGLIIQYGEALQKPEYTERGIAALRASFTMMYAPQNPATLAQWEKRWPFFGKEDYGFMMENYGHEGRTDAQGLGIGEFTIYDWGNGAAAEAWNRIKDDHPDLKGF